MSEQETLKMAAEIVDKWSGPLKKMTEALKKFHAEGKEFNDRGAERTERHAQSYELLRRQIGYMKTKGIDIAAPALGEMGITILGVSGSLAAMGAALVKSTKDWANWGQVLTFANRESGLHVDTLRGLAEANQRFGVSQDATVKSLDEFGDHMNQLARRSPIYLNEWKKYPKLWNELGQQLMSGGLSREQQLRKTMEFIPTIRDVDQRKRVLALLGLPENWATLTEHEMRDMERRAAQFTRAHPFDAQSANRMKAAIENVKTSVDGLETDLGNTFGPAGLALMNAFTDSINKVDGAIKTVIHDLREFERWERQLGKTAGDWLGAHVGGPVGKFVHSERDRFLNWLHGDKEKSKDAVKEGVKEGMTDFYNQMTDAQRLAGGYQPMAYHPTETVPAVPRFGSAEFPVDHVGVERLQKSLGGVPKSISKDETGANVPTSSSLADQRHRFATELQNNPALRDRFMRIMYNEQGANPLGTEGIAESAMNRALVRGTSLAAQLRWHGLEPGGYYQPGNMGRGALENPRIRAVLQHSLAAALAGSNVVYGATDNSSGGLAASERASGRFRFLRGINGESFFAPGWAERSFARTWNTWHDAVTIDDKRRTRLGDTINREHPTPEDELLREGKRATGVDRLDGNARLTIDLNGFPRGTKFAQKADGIFKQVTLNRGRPMVTGSEIG